MFVSHWLSLRRLRTNKHVQSHSSSGKWHRHSCLPRGTKGLCSDEHQPTTSNHHPRPHFTSTSTQPDPRFRWNFCPCSDDRPPSTSNRYKRGSALNHVQPANHPQSHCVEYTAR